MVLAKTQIDQWDVDLLRRLNSRDAECVVDAAIQMRSLTLEQICGLVRSAVRMRTPGLHRALKFAIIPFVLGESLIIWADPALAGVAICVAGAVALGVPAIVALRLTRLSDRSACFRILATHIDARARTDSFPTLVALLHEAPILSLPVQLRKTVQSSLRRILPDVTALQIESLGPEMRTRLLTLLRAPYTDVALGTALIDALGRIADPTETDVRAHLTELARTRAITPNMRAIRRASEDALDQMNKRREAGRQAQSLLRPAANSASTDPRLLLRSGSRFVS